MDSGFALIPEGAVVYFLGSLLVARVAVYGNRLATYEDSYLKISLLSLLIVTVLATGLGAMLAGSVKLGGAVAWISLLVIPVFMAFCGKISWSILGPKTAAVTSSEPAPHAG